MMLQSKLDVLTTTALQSDTICGELHSIKKREGASSVIFGPALLLLLAACGGGGGGGSSVSVANPEPADTNTDNTATDDGRVKVGAGPADADGVYREATTSHKIDIEAEAVQSKSLSAIYKSGDDNADIIIEFVDANNQLSHVFTITDGVNGTIDITVDNDPLSIQFGNNNSEIDDLSGANNITSFLDGGVGNDSLNGGQNEHNVFSFSGDNFGQDTIVNPSPKSESHFNSGDIVSFINYILRRPTDDINLREGVQDNQWVRYKFTDDDGLELYVQGLGDTPKSSVTIENAANLDIGIRSSHGNVENFIYALATPDVNSAIRGTSLADIIIGRGGDDEINSLGGDDEIVGGAGEDVIDAGEGDDYIEGGADGDTIDGGAGSDTASYASSSSAVTVNLNGSKQTISGTEYVRGHSGGHAGSDWLRNFENLLGSVHDDTLQGDDNANILEGGLGSDSLTGRDGNDVFVANINGGDADTITDFTSGDKIRVDVANPSSITDLAGLYSALNITATTDSDHDGDGNNDLILTFGGSSDYLIVLDDNDDYSLGFSDFEII